MTEEVLSTREIVKRMLENALANNEAPDYRRALIDVLQYDDRHQGLRETQGYNSAAITVSEPGRYEVSGDLSHRLRVRKVDEYPLLQQLAQEMVVPQLSPDEQFELAMRCARLEGFARRLIDLDDRERRVITLGQIQDWAKAALEETE